MATLPLGTHVQITATARVGTLDEIHDDGTVVVATNGGERMPATMDGIVPYPET